MQTLQIDNKKARKLFPTATPEFQEMLKDTFGETFFSQKVTDRVKTFEDACEVLGQSIALPFGNPLTRDEVSINSYAKLIIIARALNEGWTPDWTNGNQAKYYPYFKMGSTGIRFSFVFYDFWYSYTICSSRLCFKTRELAEYCGTQFNTEYNDFLNL